MAFLDNQGVSKLCALLKDKFDSLWTAVNGKQGALTAGSNITISGNTISATDTTYAAGTNISISNGVISATSTFDGTIDQENENGNTLTISDAIIENTYYNESTEENQSLNISSGTVTIQYEDSQNSGLNSISINPAQGGIDFENDSIGPLTLAMDSSGDLTWDSDALATQAYVTTAISGISGGSSYTAGNSGIYIDTNSNYIYNNYLPQHGIPIGLFYNSTKEYTNRGLTPSIDYLSTTPSTISFLEGKLILCSNINANQTYNVADLFPDGSSLFCQIVQVKPSGIDWANATTFNSFVGTTVSLSFYYKNYIKVGNVIFYWLDKSGWGSNANAVYNDDAVQIIRETLFPELFTSSGTSLPSAPSNDGTYLLKCVVSSGTPTYSWESVTVGGSY